jgi:hypothetical protein
MSSWAKMWNPLRHEDRWVSGGIALPLLTLALDWSEWSASHLGCFISRKRAPGTHWIGSWVGPRTGLDAMEKRKILPLLGIKSCSLSLYRLRYPGQILLLSITAWTWGIMNNRSDLTWAPNQWEGVLFFTYQSFDFGRGEAVDLWAEKPTERSDRQIHPTPRTTMSPFCGA